MKTIDLIKELATTVAEKFTDLYDKVNKTEKSVLTMKVEMSEEFKKSLQEIKDAIPEPTDPYDDSELHEELKVIKDAIPEPSEPYDDSELHEKLIQIKESMSEMKEEFVPSEALDEKFGAIKEYDDSSLREKVETVSTGLIDDMEMLKKSVEDVIEDFQGRQDTLLDDVSKRVTYEMPVPVPFDGEPLNKGAFVMWDNSLWLNKMESNSSVPGVKNHSFMQIIVAPREITHKGLFKEGEDYGINDIVMKDNASWIRVEGKSNELPGEGWKLLAKGIKGRKGDKGDPGESEVVETDQTKALEHLQDEVFILKGILNAKNTK